MISPLQNVYKFKNLLPFVVEKVILANIGTPRSVKKMRSGSLLIECDRLQQTKNLLKMKKFFEIPVRFPHTSLNSSKGVIRCPALHGDTEVKFGISRSINKMSQTFYASK